MSCACVHIIKVSNLIFRTLPHRICTSNFSTSQRLDEQKSYKLVIIGGGTGGSAIAHKFVSKLGKGNVAVLEPSKDHYYQPMFTLVGAGLKKFEQTKGQTEQVLPKGCDWIQEGASAIDPDTCIVTTENGDQIKYDYLVTALGIQLDFHKVKGLAEAMESDPQVCSNYSPNYVNKTWPAAQAHQEGNAIFTFPNTPVKCAGAPQKICYLLEEYFRLNNKREKTNVMYNTALGVIFGIPRYADALNKVVAERGITLNVKHNLIEVKSESKEAVFEILESGGKTETFKYSLLHVSPPMSAPDVLKGSALSDASGFVDVHRDTLQHKKYTNVFAIGDCHNAPNAKTAAAISEQAGVIGKNLKSVMDGKSMDRAYDGYASCPLVTTKNKCILAEFGYDGKILETFPINQAKERRSMYFMKANVMPSMYWHMLVKGLWNGPGRFRKLFHLGAGN